MGKILIFTMLLLVGWSMGTRAQDTLNVDGRHYQFLKGAGDTVKSNGSAYIIKYVTEPEEADVMRSNGKIYVVIMVLATIFAGILVYLIMLNGKITRLEKEIKH